MERLTYEVIDGGIVVDCEEIKEFEIEDGVTVYGGNAVLKLAEYEYTDLTPEQIREIDSKCVDMFGVGLMASVEKFGEFFKDITEYIEYQREKENGLLLRLPCKVGDTVFVLMKRGGATDISNGKVRKIHCGNDGIWWVEFCDLWVDVEFGDFGKIAFLSLKEAEAKLAEMEGKHE